MAALSASRFEIGSLQLAHATQGPAQPAGVTHLVNGWDPVCGGERVRFVFPGRAADPQATCPACTAATTATVPVPRQRSASTTATRARATRSTRARVAPAG